MRRRGKKEDEEGVVMAIIFCCFRREKTDEGEFWHMGTKRGDGKLGGGEVSLLFFNARTIIIMRNVGLAEEGFFSQARTYKRRTVRFPVYV